MANQVEILTQSTIEKGGVLSLVYFDVHGPDKDKIEHLLVDLVSKINKENGVVYSIGEIERAIDYGDKKYSAAAKVTVLTKSFSVLSNICDRYGPMGIEILKPSEVRLSIPDAQQLLFDHIKIVSDLLKEMVEKNMTPEERKNLAKLMDARAELGKNLLTKDSKETKESPKKK